jgi:hypothetical protein
MDLVGLLAQIAKRRQSNTILGISMTAITYDSGKSGKNGMGGSNKNISATENYIYIIGR